MQILYFVFSWILKQEEKRTRVVNIDSVVPFVSRVRAVASFEEKSNSSNLLRTHLQYWY